MIGGRSCCGSPLHLPPVPLLHIKDGFALFDNHQRYRLKASWTCILTIQMRCFVFVLKICIYKGWKVFARRIVFTLLCPSGVSLKTRKEFSLSNSVLLVLYIKNLYILTIGSKLPVRPLRGWERQCLNAFGVFPSREQVPLISDKHRLLCTNGEESIGIIVFLHCAKYPQKEYCGRFAGLKQFIPVF